SGESAQRWPHAAGHGSAQPRVLRGAAGRGSREGGRGGMTTPTLDRTQAGAVARAQRSIPGDTATLPGGDSPLMQRLKIWEDLLSLIVDRDAPGGADRDGRLLLLDSLLRSSGLEPATFWELQPARRSRAFLQRYSRAQRAVPSLEITPF